jgi:hypothetical protein
LKPTERAWLLDVVAEVIERYQHAAAHEDGADGAYLATPGRQRGTDAPPARTVRALRAIWPEGPAEAAQVVNQFALTADVTTEDGVYFLLGHFSAPIFSSPEHAQQRLQQLDGAVTIAPSGVFYMTRLNAEHT